MFGNEEITKKISKDLNFKLNFCLFEFLIEKIFNENNKIKVNASRISDSIKCFVVIDCSNDKKIYVEYYSYGFLIDNKKFYHFSSLIKREFRKEIFENQIKSINFHFYNDNNNFICDNLIHDREFPLTKNKNFSRTIFFSLLNSYIIKKPIIDKNYINIIENQYDYNDPKVFNKNLKEINKHEIFHVFEIDNKCETCYFTCSFNNKDSIYFLLDNMIFENIDIPNIFVNKEFLNNNFSLVLGCTIAQNLINFDSFIDKIIELNSENKEKYEELINFKKLSNKYRKHEILQYLTIEDIEKLILE